MTLQRPQCTCRSEDGHQDHSTGTDPERIGLGGGHTVRPPGKGPPWPRRPAGSLDTTPRSAPSLERGGRRSAAQPAPTTRPKFGPMSCTRAPPCSGRAWGREPRVNAEAQSFENVPLVLVSQLTRCLPFSSPFGHEPTPSTCLWPRPFSATLRLGVLQPHLSP